jgi:hypothetical protein
MAKACAKAPHLLASPLAKGDAVWCKKLAVYTQLKLCLSGSYLTDPKSPLLSKPSNIWVNLVSLSWMRYRFPRRNPSKGSVNWRAHCCMNAAVGWGVMPVIWT